MVANISSLQVGSNKRKIMGKILPVTSNQGDAIRDMANEKGVGRANWQNAHDDGRFSRFLDSLKTDEAEASQVRAPQHLYEFQFEKDGADASTLVARTRQTFFVSEYAEAMTNSKAEFVVGPKEKVIVRAFTCASLSVTGWTETDFFGPKGFEYVKKFGLAPCISDDAFGIRAAHPEQKLDEWIWVAHPPISALGYRDVFHVGHGRGDGRFVYGNDLHSGCRLSAGSLVAWRVASPQN